MDLMKNKMKTAFNDLLDIMQLDKGRVPDFDVDIDPGFLISVDEINIETPGILDLLGAYFSDTKQVILYPQLIEIVASKYKIPRDVLYEIVIYHEAAHAATHLGRDNHGRIWDSFDYAGTDDKEYFAQIYTYLLLLQNKSTDAIAAMERLSRCQPSKYKTYLDHINDNISDIILDDINKCDFIRCGKDVLNRPSQNATT
jgi:hypothetical protein